jgi:hypothetical protein
LVGLVVRRSAHEIVDLGIAGSNPVSHPGGTIHPSRRSTGPAGQASRAIAFTRIPWR